jgi:protocatechuate 3,4-dioxygenase beta subunit
MMTEQDASSRRSFLKQASLIALLPAVPFGIVSLAKHLNATQKREPQKRLPTAIMGGGRGICASCATPEDLSWSTTITAKNEPGEPMDMSGTIYQPDGVTPAEGIILFVYHTDATGYYNEQDDAFNPRLRAWMKTGKDGRYHFRTIKPAPYPRRTTPAHIHAHLYGPGYPEYYIDDYWFEGDKFITPTEKAKQSGRGGCNAIIALRKDKLGILKGERNIKLEHV